MAGWTFQSFFKNSVIVAVVVVIISVFLSILSGYAFGLLPLPGRKWLFPLILIGYMVPFEAVIIPLYQLMDVIHLRDTIWALILPQIGLSVSFGTLWMTSFFENAPQELIDAAAMDGSNRWQTLWLVLWPLAGPSVTTLVVLIFMWTWNEFLLALVMVQDETLRNFTCGISIFSGQIYCQHSPISCWSSNCGTSNSAGLYCLSTLFYPRYIGWSSQRLEMLQLHLSYSKAFT